MQLLHSEIGMYSILFVTTLVISLCSSSTVRYDGYNVYRIVPKELREIHLLENLLKNDKSYNFWREPQGLYNPADIMISPRDETKFNTFVSRNNIECNILMRNVQNYIEASKPRRKKEFDWTDYKSLEEINLWMEDLALKYPDVVSLLVAGSTYEGRLIRGVKVSYSSNNDKKAVFLEGGIHAREWISPATLTYILNELVTSSDPNIRTIAESFDWYVVPVVNPDGYEYTFTTDRLWRKTRQPYGDCIGADPNRNWDFHWNENGTDPDPCSDYFAGSSPFSEVEMRTLSEFISSIQDKLIGYVSFHSYSQLLLIPYGHTFEHLDNFDELYDVGLKVIESLSSRYGTIYKTGTIAEIIFVASGSSMDWVKGNYGTRITYSYELRDTGAFGYLLPPEQIIPTSLEVMDSFVTMFQEFLIKNITRT